MKTRFLPLLIALPVLSCATTPGSRPHDMSTAQHEAAAQREEAVASGHQARFEPNATITRERCRPLSGAGRYADINDLSYTCWTSVSNPTEAHRRMAEEHRHHAADHRAGSAALREAEARACAGLEPDDRDTSPFEHAEDLASVVPLMFPEPGLGQTPGQKRLAGAIVAFRAVPGMTAAWLQRLVDCHLARNASLGHLLPGMPNCPLVPKGVTATVSSAGTGFAVSIRSDAPLTAQDVLDRAQRLIPARPTTLSSQQ